jgi:hypothetical protein
MLGPDHADRRQLDGLMATESPRRATLIPIKPASTPATRIRIVIDDLINLILRAQLTTRAPMPALPTRLALLALAAHQPLRLRPRLRPPLHPRLRPILRRWSGTRPRVLTQLGL